MEAVPRMFMLSLELKWSLEKVEFGPNLRQYIQNHYMEEPSKYNEEIKQLDQLRVNATNVTRDFNGISTLKKYYGQLHLLTSRFPIADGGETAPVFTWIDTFHEEPFSHADASFDQACILYNLGVLHSVLGAKESRSSEEEMKVSCTHFQCAAGAFSYLKDHFQSYMSPDISFDLMTIYINLMLGQAQECLLEKSMQDNRKSSLVARISMQVIDYYRQALRGLEDSNISSLMGSRRSKSWKKTIQVKISHFLSVAYMYMSNQADEQQKHGERVCWLQQAVDKHGEAMKVSKGVHDTIIQALNFTKDVVLGKFQAAKKDNDFVYHEAVPSFENLPEVKGASLVKALTFQPYDESIAGPDIFKKLVPMEAHEAASLYSEEKAKILRRVGEGIEQKTKHLDQFMASLQVDQLKLNGGEEPERLPQVMLEVCAALSVKTDPIKQLVSSMQELSNVVLDVDADVKELQEVLDAEDKQEAEFQKECGKRPTKIISEIKQEFSKYREGHDKASKSNQELHKAMQVHIENIRKLAGPLDELQASLPSLKDSQSLADKEVESKLSMLIKKVEEMRTQRTNLETQLRDQLRNDDITSRIVTTEGGNIKELFKEELKKHDTLVTYIEQNLAAQDNILKALTETNAAYADTRKMHTDVSKKRDDKIQELIASYTVYDDLLAKSRKGIEFYKKLQLGLRKLLNRTNGVIKVNQEERESKLARLRPKPAQPRPTAPKPDLPVDPKPAGPKLSDFWQPKSSKVPSSSGMDGVGSVPMMPAAVSGQYPGSLDQHPSYGGDLPNAPPGPQPNQGPSSLDSHRPPSQAPAFSQPGGSSGSPSHNVAQPTSIPYNDPRMPSVAPSAPMSQPTSAPASYPSQPHSRTPQPNNQPQQSQPTSLPHSQSPMMSQSGSQQPTTSFGQPMMPAVRPQMQQPMVPQPVNPSQPQQQPPPKTAAPRDQAHAPYSQPQHGYPAASTQPPHSNPQQPIPGGGQGPSTHQPPINPQHHGIQAQPNTSTAMVSSITTPIASTLTPPPGQGTVHQPQGLHQQFIPPSGGTQQQYRGVTPTQPGAQMQNQPPMMPQSNIHPGHRQPNLPPQGSQPHQNMMQQPQQPAMTQPAGQPQYPITSQQASQSQPQQSTSPPMNYQQGMGQQPGMQAGFQQQQPQYQKPIPPVNPTQTASPQHAPQQSYVQPGAPRQPGPQPMGQAQHRHMQPNQTPTGSPQHMRPQQQIQGMGQLGPNQQPGFGQGMPQQQQQQHSHQQHQQQQQQQQPQHQQQAFNQARFASPSSQQGSPVRHAPHNIPQGQQMHPSPIQGQQAFPQQQPSQPQSSQPMSLPGVQPQQGMQMSQQPGGTQQPGIPGQPAALVGHQPSSMGQQPGFIGQQGPSAGPPASVGQQQASASMGQTPRMAQPSQGQFQQGGGQAWQPPQLQHRNSGQLPQQPAYSQQQPVPQQSGPAQSAQQPYTQQPPPPQQSGQFTRPQQGMGYAPQSQMTPQGFGQTSQAPPPVNQSGQRMPHPGNSQPSFPSLSNQRPQTPVVNPPLQPGMNQPSQSLPPPGVNPPYQGRPMQQSHSPAVLHPAGAPSQPYQQPPQPPLNQVQQVNRALKEEQQRLPQPSLQPVKIEPSSRDLLSNSPDNEQISLGKPLMPETQASESPPDDVPPMAQTETPSPPPPIHPYSSNEAALSDVFKQTGPSGMPSQPPKPVDTQMPQRPILPAPTPKPLTSEGPSVVAHPFPKPKDPYDDKQTLDKFVEEVERFEKYVDGLGKQMLSGPTVLDGLWKELSESQDRDTRQYSIAVARCYSIKNRHPDVMPYDHNRVKLQTGKDDYINASFVNDLSPASPRFIATQAPLPSTYNDFWLMVYEQQVSLIAMLVSQAPTAKTKADFDQYWPEDRGQVKSYGSILISLQSKRSTDYQTDRTFHLIHKETKQERTVFQLQFTAWPEFGVPSRPADLLQYISEVNSYYMQQRSLSTPIVVHCNSGVGRTGSFCLIYSAVREIMYGGGIVDIPRQVKTLRQQRRGMVAEKEQLKFSYMAVLCFAQQVLAKRGISVKSLVASPQVDLKHLQRITSFDVIMGADSVTSLHSRISKMSVRTGSQEATSVLEATDPAFQDDLTNPGSLSPVTDSELTNQEFALAAKTDNDTPEEEQRLSIPSEAGGDSTDGVVSTPELPNPTDPAPTLQGPPSLSELTESNLTNFSLATPQFIPDVVESSQQDGGDPVQGSESPGDGSLPSILADLTPQNFTIKGKSKQRISKADFASGKSSLGNSQSEDDPLSSLDPLWTMKGKGENK